MALYNITSHCRWSYMACCLVQLVCICSITVQTYFQVWGCTIDGVAWLTRKLHNSATTWWPLSWTPHSSPQTKPLLCTVQVLFARRGRWQVPEINKAYVFLADLTASMIFVMLLRDLEVRFPPPMLPNIPHSWFSF